MAERLSKKVLLIGWDAADWQIINPLLDSGLMPNFERLVNSGVVGNIATLRPAISPILWNSIATGKLPKKHGICGFTEPMPDGSGIRPVTSTSRKCKALWNILSQSGLRSNVVSWFASHPAEPIKGSCVSNLFHVNSPVETDWPITPQSIHPPNLAETLAEFRLDQNEIREPHLLPFIPRASEIDQTTVDGQRALYILQKHLAECASVHAIATHLMERETWDFTAVYYNTIDLLCHHFMPYHPPKLEIVSAKDFEMFKGVINGIYCFHDMMLGRLLQLAGEETTVILLSDHGFYSDHLRPRAVANSRSDAASWHRSHGVLALKGKPFLKDERIYGSSLLDIAPTILTLFGLPVGEDMDGKVLVQGFKTPPEIERIPSWETVPGNAGMHPPDLQQDPVAAHEALQQLVDLGYMAAPDADVKKTIQQTTDDLKFNLALSILNYGDPKEALDILESLFVSRPDEIQVGLALAQAHFAAGQSAQVRTVLCDLEVRFPKNPNVELMFGSLLLVEGDREQALKRLQRAEELSPNLPQLHIRLGNAYLRSREWRKAEHAFRRTLEIEGDNAEGCHGLSVALLRQNKLDEAAEMALRAVGLQHYFPAAHFQLGAVLARLNQPERAALAFEHGLTMKPGVLVAHRYLARLYYRLGQMKKCHDHHEVISRLKESALKTPPQSPAQVHS